MKKRIKTLTTLATLILFSAACFKSTVYYSPQERNEILVQKAVIITMKDGTEYIIKVRSMDGIKIKGELKNDERVEINVQEVESIRMEKSDNSLGIFLGLAAAVTVALVIGISTAPDPQGCCPFVYAYDGENFVFDGEPFGAAISEGLKRAEWSELEYLREVSGEYRLLITNEMDETQFIDEIKLIVADHPQGTRVVPDVMGRVSSIAQPLSPVHSSSGSGEDITVKIAEKDGEFWMSPGTDQNAVPSEHLKDELILEFPKPEDAKKAKLVINANTTLWGAYMGRKFLDLYGNGLDQWYAEVDQKGPAYYRTLSWYDREELYMMKIRCLTPDGWETKGTIHSGGPMIAKDKLYDIDVSDIPGDTLKVKLTPPGGFWQIDWIAVDYTQDVPLVTTELAPIQAVDNRGEDVRDLLTATDAVYQSMPDSEQWTRLRFVAPPRLPGLERTVILKACGYYKLHLEAGQDPPRWDIIDRLQNEPGFTIRYAREQFRQWKQEHGHIKH